MRDTPERFVEEARNVEVLIEEDGKQFESTSDYFSSQVIYLVVNFFFLNFFFNSCNKKS